jgi:NAD-dependent dihydropyrimidine dehydrogenase PreA subunit
MGKKIVFCNCSGERINPERLHSIEDSLRNCNAQIAILSDLCGLSALNKERLIDIFRKGNEYLIIGCYSRSMKLLLEWSSIDLNNISIEFANFIESADEEIFQKVSSFCENSDRQWSVIEIGATSGWPAWFPIVDYSRCSTCGQCADFCLFGVYEKSDGRVNVVNPQGCKNNCPACGRICPETAIIFPKYKFGGAIGGSEQIDEMAEQARQSLDIKQILKEDIYEALEQRKRKRLSIIRNETMQKAIEDRDNALNKN